MDTLERDQLIAKLADEGQSLSDIQKVLKDEHGLQLTYMELRLIADDLAVSWDKYDAVKESEKKPDPKLSADGVPSDPSAAPGLGQTVVNVSKLVRPGSVMSGDVTFKSGATAEWFLDAMGRLGLNPTGNSEKPSEEDLQEFQIELQRSLQGKM